MGHEVDETIADFVADLRAPTPSAAAELVTPDIGSLRRDLTRLTTSITNLTAYHLEQHNSQHQQIQNRLTRLNPIRRLEQQREQVDELANRLQRACRARLVEHKHQLALLETRLEGSNPQAMLLRGFAIVEKAGKLVTRQKQLQPNNQLKLTFSDGWVEVVVTQVSNISDNRGEILP